MANVLFKRGLQTSLDQMRTGKNATDGIFYMTSDSHRLYIGISNGDAVPVNEGITIVSSLSQLPEVTTYDQKRIATGQFYYVDGANKDNNILCVFNGQKWVQINPNTNTEITGVEFTIGVVNNKATITHTITDTDGGTHADDFTITGANGVLVSNTGTDVTITGDKYELGASYNSDTKIATVSLTSANTDNDTKIKLTSKNNNLNMRMSDSETLELEVKDTVLESIDLGYGVSPDDTATNKEGFYVDVKDSAGNEKVDTLNPTFQVGGNAAYFESSKMINGKVVLPVYSTAEIDRKIRSLDAMTYKGTLGAGCTVTSLTPILSTLELGDTYLIGAATYEVTISSTTYKGKKGDMFICNGTEIPATGKIDSSTVTIDIVPSGDDVHQDTTYVVTPTPTGFTLTGSTGTDAGSVEVKGDSKYLSASAVASATDPKKAVITVSHNLIDSLKTTDTSGYDYTAANDLITQAQGDVLQVQIVESITRDAAGHVKSVKVKKYNLKDTNGHMDSASYTATVNAEKTLATVTGKTIFSSEKGVTSQASAAFGIQSASMEVTATGATVNVDMVWGSF